MGIHLHLVHRNGVSFDDWDEIRHAGDNQFPSWMAKLERVWLRDIDDEIVGYRPVDFDRWRQCLPADRPNPQRFLKMFDILEQNSDIWIHESW